MTTRRARSRLPRDLTPQELTRLVRWANAYRAEVVFGATNGKAWAFARYLVQTGRLNEDHSRARGLD